MLTQLDKLNIVYYMSPEYFNPCLFFGEGFHDDLDLLFSRIFGVHEDISIIRKTTFPMLLMYLCLYIILLSWWSGSMMVQANLSELEE